MREDACCLEHAYDKAGIGLFSYNSRHQQTRVETENGDVQENRYDVENLRFELLENGNRTAFVYHNGELLHEEGGKEKQTSYHLGAGTSAFQRGQETYYYHRDEQLSTAFITGTDGTVRNSYQYDAFGNLSDTIEQLPNRVRYTGQQYDELTGQYYLRARYYNPVLGRFMQEDTYQGDGLNLYAYCKNNPVAYYDPSGYSRDSKNPNSGCVEAKIGEDEEIESGKYPEDIIQYEKLKSQYAADEIYSAERIGNALKEDSCHRAAGYLSNEQLASGRTYSFTGGDSKSYTLLQTKGQFDGVDGIFEYVTNDAGQVTHQRFIKGGVYAGFPNQVIPKGGYN